MLVEFTTNTFGASNIIKEYGSQPQTIAFDGYYIYKCELNEDGLWETTHKMKSKYSEKLMKIEKQIYKNYFSNRVLWSLLEFIRQKREKKIRIRETQLRREIKNKKRKENYKMKYIWKIVL